MLEGKMCYPSVWAWTLRRGGKSPCILHLIDRWILRYSVRTIVGLDADLRRNHHRHLVLWLRYVTGVILLWRPAHDCQKLQISQFTRWLHSCLILTIRIFWDKIPCRCLSWFWRFEERHTLQGSRGHQWTDLEPAEPFTLFSHPHSKASPLQGWTGSSGSKSLRLPEFLYNRHIKVVRLPAFSTGRLCLPRDIPGTNFC